jgi:hypothetical protein
MLAVLKANPIFGVLADDCVGRQAVPLGQPFEAHPIGLLDAPWKRNRRHAHLLRQRNRHKVNDELLVGADVGGVRGAIQNRALRRLAATLWGGIELLTTNMMSAPIPTPRRQDLQVRRQRFAASSN